MEALPVNYSELTGEEKRQRAIADAKEFAPEPDWDKAFAEISEQPHTEEAARAIEWQLEIFLGISGYPVVAILAHCWNLSDDEVVKMLAGE